MKFATLEIDGVKYSLAYDFNAICKIEELTGVNLLEALESLQNGLSASQLRGLFLAALEAGPEAAFPGKTPRESLETAGELIRLDTLLPITKALSEAYNLSMASMEPVEPVSA